MAHPTSFRRWRGSVGSTLLFVVATTSSLHGQQIDGVVLDAARGTPVAEVLVRVSSVGSVTLTNHDGAFELYRIPDGRQQVTFEALGYGTVTLEVDSPVEEPLRVLLRLEPIELEEIRVEVESFETRVRTVETTLDRRLARLPGYTRVVGREDIRPYDSLHAKDPWTFLSSEMRIGWAYEEDTAWIQGRKVEPEVYIDDRPTWLFDLVHAPLGQFCRFENYIPGRSSGRLSAGAPTQIRAYTCLYMAQVADGQREPLSHINWGSLISWR